MSADRMLSVRIPEELFFGLKEKATRERVTITAVVETLVSEYLGKTSVPVVLAAAAEDGSSQRTDELLAPDPGLVVKATPEPHPVVVAAAASTANAGRLGGREPRPLTSGGNVQFESGAGTRSSPKCTMDTPKGTKCKFCGKEH